MSKLHWVACKMNEPRRVHIKILLVTTCSLHFDKHQIKNKFIGYIYIHFNQNLDEKSYISAKIEAVKHLHAVLLQ